MLTDIGQCPAIVTHKDAQADPGHCMGFVKSVFHGSKSSVATSSEQASTSERQFNEDDGDWYK